MTLHGEKYPNLKEAFRAHIGREPSNNEYRLLHYYFRKKGMNLDVLLPKRKTKNNNNKLSTLGTRTTGQAPLSATQAAGHAAGCTCCGHRGRHGRGRRRTVADRGSRRRSSKRVPRAMPRPLSAETVPKTAFRAGVSLSALAYIVSALNARGIKRGNCL